MVGGVGGDFSKTHSGDMTKLKTIWLFHMRSWVRFPVRALSGT